MPYATFRDVKLFYTDQGRGFPLVLTHGLGSDHTMWALQSAALSKKYRVITWDVRGHGRSEVTESGYSINQFVADLYELLIFLRVPRAHIGGLSMGGWISFSFALAHPEMAASLVLSNSAGFLKVLTKEQIEGATNMLGASAHIAEKEGRGGTLLNSTIELMFSKKYIDNNPEAVDLVKKRIAESPALGYARTIRGLFLDQAHRDWNLVEQKLGTIKAKTLIVAGDQDALTPLATQQALHRAIPGSRLEVFQECGHVSCIEQPEKWTMLVMEFLGRVDTE